MNDTIAMARPIYNWYCSCTCIAVAMAVAVSLHWQSYVLSNIVAVAVVVSCYCWYYACINYILLVAVWPQLS
jgi:hypothetical protein